MYVWLQTNILSKNNIKYIDKLTVLVFKHEKIIKIIKNFKVISLRFQDL